MRYIFLIFSLLTFSCASNLLTYNIYERTDRVDLMLSFDAPYEGSISQKKGENIITLSLSDLSYDALIEKNIDSKILQELTIEPVGQTLQIVLKSADDIAVIASKTVDGFGLRIRAKPIILPAKVQNTPLLQSANQRTVATENSLDFRYFSVIIVLLILLAFMFWLKKRVTKSTLKMQKKGSWLFNSSMQDDAKNSVKVLHKKPIDDKNCVVLLEFAGVKYLVITGNSNLLLERFSNDEIQSSSDFEKAFEENRKKLDDFLKLQDDKNFDEYKAKASKDHSALLDRY